MSTTGVSRLQNTEAFYRFLRRPQKLPITKDLYQVPEVSCFIWTTDIILSNLQLTGLANFDSKKVHIKAKISHLYMYIIQLLVRNFMQKL